MNCPKCGTVQHTTVCINPSCPGRIQISPFITQTTYESPKSGWQCPECKTVYAPWWPKCECAIAAAPAEDDEDDPDPLAWVEDSPWAEEGKT